ncbi:unnamed protein product [Cercospora beticola]|nr:unnamed protein product [Cercospora beticola]
MVRASILHACLITAFVSASVLPVEPCKNGTATISTRQQELKPMNSKELEDSIKEEALLQKARELQDAAYKSPMRNRMYGTPGHENTLQLIEKYLKTVEEHYTIERQEFKHSDNDHQEWNGTFTVAGKQYDLAINRHYYGTTDSTSTHNITGKIAPIANFGCNPSDFPPKSDLQHTIALIRRGNCTYEEKLAEAKLSDTRAEAVVIINNSTEPLAKAAELTSFGWPKQDSEPLIVISQADGEALATMAASISTEGVLQMQELQEKRKTYNLIAQTKRGDPDNVLVVGAHSDSVFAGPGINDNGSGLIAILETALHLPKYAVTNAVRFAFWSAEEVGLVGSEKYLERLHDSEKDKIRLYLNFDMIASPNFVYGLYDGNTSEYADAPLPSGSAEAEHFFQK